MEEKVVKWSRYVESDIHELEFQDELYPRSYVCKKTDVKWNRYVWSLIFMSWSFKMSYMCKKTDVKWKEITNFRQVSHIPILKRILSMENGCGEVDEGIIY